ncbi:acyl-CoA dehydrogenase family protein [Arthrobacter sp. LAPM80]|uniref:acyl-CoA dehydrogenase family protein n=1 Tax=Arthrobacter sp. LAPM80 TaxID=3141788 RepID=UPI00398A8241
MSWAVEGQGFYQLVNQLPQERLITAILAQAMSEAAVAAALEYTKTREAFGKPLFEVQNTRFELAECATITQVNRVFLDARITKQIFGGYGYMMEYPIAGMYQDNRVLRVLAGAN